MLQKYKKVHKLNTFFNKKKGKNGTSCSLTCQMGQLVLR